MKDQSKHDVIRVPWNKGIICLLYTSDAADDVSTV